MGIDVYLLWDNMTEQERAHQARDDFSCERGHEGYLREAFHGGPYVTKYLLREAFAERGGNVAEIPANLIRHRLAKALVMAAYRDFLVYDMPEKDPRIVDIPKEIKDDKEKATAWAKDFAVQRALMAVGEIMYTNYEELADAFPSELVANADRYIDDEEYAKIEPLPSYIQSFVDFWRLAKRKEEEQGHPVRIVAWF